MAHFMSKDAFKHWKEGLQSIVRRFPLTLFFTIASCLSLMYLNHYLLYDGQTKEYEFFLMIYPFTATILSLTLHLWTEDMRQRLKAWGWQGAIHALWLALCIYWATEYELSIGQSIAAGTCVGAMLVGWFTLPFAKQTNDRPAINFLIRLMGSGIIAAGTSLVLFLGILLLIQSFKYLFNMDIEETLYVDTANVCFTLVAPLLFMFQLPKDEQKYSQYNWLRHKFGNGIIHYLLIPLHLAYVITLYLYAVKILVIWELPNGWVSTLVSVLMLLTVIILFLLYPIHQQNQVKPVDRLAVRYLPIIVLPLLVLMSVGIGRRFSDYGVTIQRLYLLLFNLWCYAVCIGLIVCRSRKVMWVAWSFVAILLLVSVFPVNVSSFTHNRLQKQVRELLAKHNITKFPINSKTYTKLLKQVGYQQAKSLAGKLNYLNSTYDSQAIEDIIKPRYLLTDYQVEEMYGHPISRTSSKSIPENTLISDKREENIPLPIPPGYRYFQNINQYPPQKDAKIEGDKLLVTMKYQLNGKSLTDHYQMSLAEIERKVNGKEKFCITATGKQTQLVITYLYLLYGEDYVDMLCQGTLFVK